MTHHVDLTTIRLAEGSHNGRSKEGCLLEWVAMLQASAFELLDRMIDVRSAVAA